MRPRPVCDATAKYFFFHALDHAQVFRASTLVLGRLARHDWLGEAHRSRWVEALSRASPLKRGGLPAGKSFAHGGFKGPGGVDLSLWISFQVAGKPDEIEAVLFSKLLGFSDPEIARGLGCGEGTVRYRVGRGLRHLGSYLEA